jgi:hypothetical protein
MLPTSAIDSPKGVLSILPSFNLHFGDLRLVKVGAMVLMKRLKAWEMSYKE